VDDPRKKEFGGGVAKSDYEWEYSVPVETVVWTLML
jgi:hypothetical protein